MAGRIVSLNIGPGGVPKYSTGILFVAPSEVLDNETRALFDPTNSGVYDIDPKGDGHYPVDCHADQRKHGFRDHGGPDRVLSFFDMAWIEAANHELGLELVPGSRGENVTTDGLDYSKLVPGSQLKLGNPA